jgi:hypothetical protein
MIDETVGLIKISGPKVSIFSIKERKKGHIEEIKRIIMVKSFFFLRPMTALCIK